MVGRVVGRVVGSGPGYWTVTRSKGRAMAGHDVEVYYQDAEWRVGIPLGEDPISRHASQDEAVAAGRADAANRGVALVIRDEHGTVLESDASDSGEAGTSD